MNDRIRADRILGAERPFLPAPALVVVGASTGGPQALIALLTRIAPTLRRADDADPSLSICVTLHMPRDLMPVIAAHVARRCGIATRVVAEPCRLGGRKVYFAQGDLHLGFERGGGDIVVPVASPGRRRSGVDAMFASAADGFGARVLGIVLSGMGQDGLAGARAIVERGGTVFAQDRTSAAVWGMPGAVVRAGLAAEVLSPAGLAAAVIGRIGTDRTCGASAGLAIAQAAKGEAVSAWTDRPHEVRLGEGARR